MWEPQSGDIVCKKNNKNTRYRITANTENLFEGQDFCISLISDTILAGGGIWKWTLMNEYELVERPKTLKNLLSEELLEPIKKLSEEYSFNIESEFFHQLPKDLQIMWKREIEQTYQNAYNQGVKDTIDKIKKALA